MLQTVHAKVVPTAETMVELVEKHHFCPAVGHDLVISMLVLVRWILVLSDECL